jgi:muramidase (phage lysozyme)
MIIDELVAVLSYKTDAGSEQNLKNFKKGMDDLEKAAYKVGQTLGRTAALAGAAIATGFTFLGKSVLDTAGKFEQFQTTLETIEGSAEKAKKSMDWIAKFARETPYEVEGLTAAFVKLKAYGIDPMDGTLKTLGDTASAMGKSLNMAVEALADASTGEFERLKEFGITTKTVGDKATFSWTQNGKLLTKTVGKNAVEIRKFILENFGARFAGAMDKQSKTWKGMLSNLADAWTDFERQIADAGFFDVAKKKIRELLDAIDRMANDGSLKKIASFMSGVFAKAFDLAAIAIGRLVQHITWITSNWDKAAPILTKMAVALGVLVAAAFPLTTAFTALFLVMEDIMTYMQGGNSLIGELFKAAPSIQKAFEGLFGTGLFGDPLRDLRQIYEFLTNLGAKIGEWGDQWNAYKEKIWNIFKDATVEWTKAIADWFTELPFKFIKLGTDIVDWMIEGFKGLGTKLSDYLTTLFQDALKAAFDYIKSWLPGGATKTGYGGDGEGGYGGATVQRASISSTGGYTAPGGSGQSGGTVSNVGGTGGAEAGGVAAPILDAIARSEGTYKTGYQSSFGHQLEKQGVDITKMTLGQILTTQRGMRGSSAIGRYQFMRNTLFGKGGKGGLVQELGLGMDEQFTPELQDRLGMRLLQRRGYDAWKAGKISDAEFQDRIAHEWAGVSTSTGRSVYAGVGLNRATANRTGMFRSAFAATRAGKSSAVAAGGAGTLMRNYDTNTGKLDGGAAGATINNDSSGANHMISVQAPVNVHVAKADDAPDATARAVGKAVNRGAMAQAKPSRMQASAAA